MTLSHLLYSLYEQMLKKAFKTEDVIRTKTHKQPDWYFPLLISNPPHSPLPCSSCTNFVFLYIYYNRKVYWSFLAPRTGSFERVLDVWGISSTFPPLLSHSFANYYHSRISMANLFIHIHTPRVLSILWPSICSHRVV